jgi:uncharacterized protein (PEP-CTERM system associated)
LRALHPPHGIVAFFTAAAVMTAAAGRAQAQTVDYFSTPWIAQPGTANPNGGAGSESPSSGGAGTPSAISSGLYARAQAQSSPNARPWNFSAHVGIDEIATDNPEDSASDRTIDLASLFFAGITASADTARLNGILSATGLYRQDLEESSLDRFAGYGYVRGQGTIVPDSIFMYIRGLEVDISRQGGGLDNALIEPATTTHIYEISGTPYLYSIVDDFAVNVLRYQIGQVWFDRNTGLIQDAGETIPAISDSTDQMAREDFRMAGTVLPRLLTDVSLAAQENDSGSTGSGDFTRDRGEAINEYELTRSFSVIGGAGYERLHDEEFPNIDGEGLVWDIGARIRPNADSYALLTYGRHDLKDDFAGELVWRVSPLTNIYGAYTDSITNGQQTLIAGNDASELGPEGTTTHLTFDESTVIGTLDDALLNASPGAGGSESLLGVSQSDINNALPLENGLFRVEAFRATARTLFDNNPINLTVLHIERTQLTDAASFGQIGRVETSNGVILSWHPTLTNRLTGLASIRYERVDLGEDQPLFYGIPTNSDDYGAALGLTWIISGTLSGIARYDFVYRQAHSSSDSSYENALTIGLRKTFD